jgi:hypothetical protein
MIGSRAHIVGQMVANSPAFPPSFDNSPVLFGMALFARLLIALLSAATIVRIISRTRIERLPCDHPVYYHRMMVGCLLTSACMGSTSDVLNWLLWGELSAAGMGRVMLICKLLDALTMVPFLMALFVPYWVKYLRRCGMFHGAGAYVLSGKMQDMRITWGQVGVPMRLVAWSAFGAAGAAFSKYVLWFGVPHVVS